MTTSFPQFVVVRDYFYTHIVHDKYVWRDPDDDDQNDASDITPPVLSVLLASAFMVSQVDVRTGAQRDPVHTIADVQRLFQREAGRLAVLIANEDSFGLYSQPYTSYARRHRTERDLCLDLVTRAPKHIRSLFLRGYLERAETVGVIHGTTALPDVLGVIVNQYYRESIVERLVRLAREETTEQQQHSGRHTLQLKEHSRSRLTALQRRCDLLEPMWDGYKRLDVRDNNESPATDDHEAVLVLERVGIDKTCVSTHIATGADFPNVQVLLLSVWAHDLTTATALGVFLERITNHFPALVYTEILVWDWRELFSYRKLVFDKEQQLHPVVRWV